ncbi:uridine diphosphate glucose pyrophosphatase NUDT14 isoform X2 [Salmo trutta]|uniref:uridine diphosphate glucose pyrophosphatase NUDT14 isoform X2 n=1 Tax=Salmo trutta TaxID=8032 RepID=UPI00112FE29B|nr:uridine diphosphate glucose pyrophosphatase-like isoform X2 [Salmo trutta]
MNCNQKTGIWKVLSVSVLIFNTTSHCFVLVKQFRPAVYMCEWERTKPKAPDSGEQAAEEKEGAAVGGGETPPGSVGMTYELCAGLVDKADLSLEEIARQEVLEECGYDVPVAKLRRITSYRSGVGVTGAKQTMFYAEVSDENCVGEGGGEPQEGELIEVVKVPLHEAMTFAYDESIPKTMGVIFSFIWFHNNMSPKYKISTNV